MESSTIDFPFSLTDYRYSADVIPFEGILTRFNFARGAEQYTTNFHIRIAQSTIIYLMSKTQSVRVTHAIPFL